MLVWSCISVRRRTWTRLNRSDTNDLVRHEAVLRCVRRAGCSPRSKSQASNPKLQGNSKLQIHKPCSGGYQPPIGPNVSTLPAFSAEVDWSLEFGSSLELGSWSLMLP